MSHKYEKRYCNIIYTVIYTYLIQFNVRCTPNHIFISIYIFCSEVFKNWNASSKRQYPTQANHALLQEIAYVQETKRHFF